jgi:hypothetical protein
MPHEQIGTLDANSASSTRGTIQKGDGQTQTFKNNNLEQCSGYQVQLGRWAYEVDKENLTLTEKLEKMKWETKRLQKL